MATGDQTGDKHVTEPLSEIVAELGRRLQAQGLRLCTAESCTGGGIAQAMTDRAGSSAGFECAWVTYSNAAKTRLLGVSEALLEEHGAVSAPVAAAMATGALERCDADLVVAVTGIAGPGGGTAQKPVGLVWFAWQRRGQPPCTDSRVFPGTRAEVREATVRWALQQLLAPEWLPAL